MVTDDWRSFHITDEEWEVEKTKENRELKIYHNWCQRRLTEFYDIVQPRLFTYFPALNELEGDYWVLYAVCLRDNYEEWLTLCEHMETVMVYKMPPESVNLSGDEFMEIYRRCSKKDKGRAENERNRRINEDYPWPEDNL